MSTSIVFDFLIVVCGGYLIYSAVTMKQTGNIPTGVLVNKDTNLANARDKQGFIDYMFLKTIILGIVTLLSGATGIFNDYYGGLGVINAVLSVIFLICLIVFMVFTSKAHKKFL